MLPKKTGQQVLKEIRNQGVLCPVILVTALGSLDDTAVELDYYRPGGIVQMVLRQLLTEPSSRPEPFMRRP